MKSRVALLRLLARKKEIATEKGVPFNLTVEDLPDIPERCPVLGIPLSVSPVGCDDYSPSLDRISAEMGYVPGNLIWVSNRVNRLKSDSHWKELELIATFYKTSFPDAPEQKYLLSHKELEEFRVSNGRAYIASPALDKKIDRQVRMEVLEGMMKDWLIQRSKTQREFQFNQCISEMISEGLTIQDYPDYEQGIAFHNSIKAIGPTKRIGRNKRYVLL